MINIYAKIIISIAVIAILVACSKPANTNKTITAMFDHNHKAININMWTIAGQ